MKKSLSLLILLVLLTTVSWAQLTGSKYIPGTSGPNDYATITLAIADLNAQGVGIGGVTFYVAPGYTETISAPLSITATGTAANPIKFQMADAGTHPLITSYIGSKRVSSAVQDGIWNFIGSDYVTIDGIDLLDPNTFSDSTMMEYGYGFFKASATNGCQYNTIQNCVVTLNKNNNTLGGNLAVDGSKAINVVNALVSDQITVVTPTSTSGTNSYNRFYHNTLQNCNIGIALIGFVDVTSSVLCDFGNDIGGSSAATGNNIINFGGAAGLAGTTNPAAGIRTLGQYDINVSFNTLNNNNGSGVNHGSIIRGIYLNTAINASSTISNNTITIKSFMKTSTNGQVSAIENVSGASGISNTINISQNTITNCTNDSCTQAFWYGIYNTASCANLKIIGNTLSNNTTKATTGNSNLILNSGATTLTDSICGNNISFSHINTLACSASIYSIYTSGATSTCNVVINNNNFSNYNFNTPGTSSLYFINNAASSNTPLNVYISNNTWSNLTLNYSGTIYLCFQGASIKGPVFNFTNNYIAGGITRPATATVGTFYGLYNAASSIALQTVTTITDNDFSNITASGTGSGSFTGIYESGSAPSPYGLKIVHNNTVSNISFTTATGTLNGIQVNTMGPGISSTPSKIYDNTITGISTAGTINGLNLGATTSISLRYQAYNNTINTLTSSGASSVVTGANVSSSGAGADFFKHNIYNIKASGASAIAYGISIPSGGINTNIYNNYISDIKSTSNTNTTITDGVRGISITSTSATSNINLYYNTIYLNATSSGTNFSSSAVFHTAPSSTIATTAVLNMQNNIIVNNSTAKGTGIASAFRRNWPTYGIATISPSCNFNCFYAGAPSTTHLIFYDGTNLSQTMAAYQGVVTDRDLQSFREMPPFNNIATTPYDLHLTSSTPTQCESGGQQIAGIITDFDEDARFGSPTYGGAGTLTDIGADEGDFLMASDVIAPAIVYTAAPNTPYATTTITATITDPSGIPTSGIGLPVLKWKINAPGSWNTVTSTSLGNNLYSFTFGSGAVTGDSVLYYIAAQDYNYNVGSYPFLGAATPSFNPPGFTTPPTNLSKFKKLAAISGVYTIDTTMATGGTNFKTFTDAVNFLNAAGITSSVTFNVTAGQSWANTCSGSPLSALRITNTGATATNTVTFQKSGAGANPVINVTGTSGSTDYGIYLEDTKYIIFDGINVVDVGTSASNWLEYGIYLKGTAIGCQYNTIKNAEVNLERNNTNATYGIYSFSAASPFVGTNSYNKFYNNSVKDCRYGYYVTGASTTYKDTLNEIGNIPSGVSLVQGIGSSTVTGAPFGIYGKWQEGMKVFNTIIDTVVGYQSIITGMEINSSSNLSIYGNTLKNITKTGTTSNSDIYIMNITTSLDGTHNIYNNTLYNCSIPATFVAPCNINGIRAYDGTSNWNIYGNTIYNLKNARGAVTGIYHAVASGITTNIFNNKCFNFQSDTSNSWVAPIYGGVATTNYTVYNNYVYDIKNATSTIATQPAVQGISVAGGNWKIYNNTVYLDYLSSNAVNTSAALYVSTATATVDIRNNIFVNKCNMTIGARAVAFWYTGGLPYTNIAATSNNNLYYSGIPGPKNLIFCDSLTPVTTNHFMQTLAAYKTLTGLEANSVTEDPPFVSNVSPYDLHMQTTIPTICEGKGQFIATVATDYDGDSRNPSTPDIGADEFSGIAVVQCSGTPAATSISGAASICTNTSTALTLSPVVTDLGITHQWAYSTTPGGPYTQLGTFSAQSTGNITIPNYYIDTIRCTNSGLFYVTAEKSVFINQYPVSSATVVSSPICANGTLNLQGTTDIGTSFNWTGPNGFTSTSQNPSIPSATTAASGTYFFTSTSNACISPVVTVSAIVNQTPTAVTVTPLSTSICSGNIQQLTASGGIVTGIVILSENFNAPTNNWTKINNSVGSKPDTAAWKLKPSPFSNSLYSVIRSNDTSQFYISNSYDLDSASTVKDTARTYLQSPAFSTLNFSAVTVNFYQYLFKYGSNDSAKVEASTNGTTWTTLQSYASSVGQATGFLPSPVTLTAPFLNQATVYIRFKYIANNGGYMWALDNVSISGTKTILPTWLPISGLYSDAAATTPYVIGTTVSSVYAKPDPGTANYNATATTSTDNCSITSNTAVVNVTAPSVGGTATATATSVCTGSGTSISLTGYTGNIQWQSSLNGSTWGNINNETSTTLLTGNLTVNTYYKAIVTNGICTSAPSTSTMVTVVALPVAGSVSGGSTINLGQSTGTLTLSGQSSTIINWQYQYNGGGYTDIPSTTGLLTYSDIPTASGTYDYRAVIGNGVCNNVYSTPTSVIVIAVTTPGLWTGALSTNWSVSGNWDDGIVPTSLVNVVIPSTAPNQPHITTPVTSAPSVCNNLTINSGASLSIDAGKALSVSGTITNNAGTTGLQIKSSTAGTGSLIHTTASVNASVERYISHTNTDEFHMLASPVAAQSIAPDFNQLQGFYLWNEATANWIGYTDGSFATLNGGSNFVPGKGYAVSYPSATTKTFAGVLNQGNVNIPLSFTAGTYSGWNFVANPYPSSINWDAASGWTRTDLDDAGGGENAMWIWNATVGNYGTYISNAGVGNGTNDVTSEIPLSQGFWVKTIGSGNLGMSNSVRIHSSQNFLKSTTSTTDMLRLMVSGSANTYSDEIIVKFGNNNDLGGAQKMFSIEATAPSLYSTKLSKNWSINNLTSISQNPIVAVSFKPGVNGSYTLKTNGINSFTTPTYVYLNDLFTNTITDLNQNTDYTFTTTTNDNANRFQLLFALSPLGISNNNILNTNIYSYDNAIYINSNEAIQQIAIYNTLGQIIKTVANTNGKTTVNMKDAASGYYIVRVVTSKNVYSEKVLIK